MTTTRAAARRRPLAGRRVVVTRARGQAGPLSALLRRNGAVVLEVPTIDVRPIGDWRAVDRELSRLDRYDAILFTSQNAVGPFVERWGTGGRDRFPRIGAVGPATAKALRRAGVRVDWVAAEHTGAALGREVSRRLPAGSTVLHPAADKRRPELERELRGAGLKVTNLVVYRLRRPSGTSLDGVEGADWLTFASAQTVRNFDDLVPPRLRRAVHAIPAACIGPVTAKAARELGYRVRVMPGRHTIPGLVEALCRRG